MMTFDEAKTLTARIQQALDDLVALVILAYHGEADRVLGYTSWEDYVQAEFPNLPRMQRLQRQEAARELTATGMSLRATATALGVTHATIAKDLRGQVLPERSPRPTRASQPPVREKTPRLQRPPSYRITRPERPERVKNKDQWTLAEELAAQDVSFSQIAKKTGLGLSLVVRDLRVRQARATVNPSISVYGTRRHLENTIACDVTPAPAVIREVELNLIRLLSNIYTLSRVDRGILARVLEDARQRLGTYEEETQ